MADLSIAIEILGIDKASGPFGAVAKGAGGLLGGLRDLGLGALGIGTAFDTVKGAVEGLLGPAIDAQQVATQTAAVLQSTGGAAGLTADDISGLAGELSKLTPFEDEAIQSAENLLLTFTSIGGDIMPQATETVLNMSQALGQDLKSSSVQLGKALNDPIKGMTALSRVGVSFTDEQKEQIKTLQESGDMMGAQTVILKELDKEFGGAAKAAGQTFGGQMVILQTAIGNVAEAIGGPLIKGLSSLATAALPAVQAFADELPAAIDTLMATAQPFIDGFIGGIQGGFKLLVAFLGGQEDEIGSALDNLFGGLAPDAVISFVLDVRTAFNNLTTIITDAFGTIQQVFQGDWSASDSIDPVVNLVGQLATVVRDDARTISDAWGTVQQVFANDWSASDQIDPVVNGIGILATVVRDDAIPAVQQLGAFLLNPLGSSLSAAAQFVHDNVGAQAALVGVLGSAATAWGLMSAASAAAALQTSIVAAATRTYAAVQAVLNVALTANPIGLLVVGLAGLAAGLIYAYNTSEDFRAGVDGAMASATAAIDGLVDFVQGVPAAFDNLSAGLGSFFDGLSNDLTSTLNGIAGAIGGTFNALGTGVQDALGTIGSMISAGWQAANDAGLALVQGFQTAVKAVWDAIPADITADLVLIATTLTTRFGETLTTITAWGQTVLSTVGAAWTTVATTVDATLTGLLTAIGTWVTDTTTAFTTWATSVGTEATTAVVNLTTPIITGTADILAKIGTWVTDVVGQLTSLGTQAGTAATETAANITTPITTGIADVLGKVGTWAGEMLSKLGGLANDAKTAAGDIGWGIINGVGEALAEGGTLVAKLLADLARGWIKDAKTLLGIESPSKVFFGIGQNITQGLALGIQSGGGQINDVMQIVINEAIKNGIDPLIALALAKAESGLNPNAIGDQGHSVGLFQLHDQGQGAGQSVAQRQDPQHNAGQFLAAHAALYKQLVAEGLAGDQLAATFGRLAEQSDPQYAQRYAQAYRELVAELGTTNLAARTSAAGVAMLSTTQQQGITWAQQMASQQALLSSVLDGQMDPLRNTKEAMAQFGAVLGPIERQVAGGSISLETLQFKLVDLARATGLATEPWDRFSAGTIDADQAMEQVINSAADAGPQFDALRKYFDTAGSSSREAALQFLQLALNYKTATPAIDATAAATGTAAEQTGQATDAVGDLIGKYTTIKPLISDSTDLVKAFGKAVGELDGGPVDHLADSWDSLAGKIHGATGELKDYLNTLGDAGGGGGDIPHFKQGGMMDHDGLAFLHAGEQVLTAGASAPTFATSGNGGGGGDTYITNHFNFPNYVGSRAELINMVESGLATKKRSNHKLAFESR